MTATGYFESEADYRKLNCQREQLTRLYYQRATTSQGSSSALPSAVQPPRSTHNLGYAKERRLYWVLGGQRQISKVIKDCVTCKRVRGKRQDQIMADLPEERVTEAPPFTFVGVDVFGPFKVQSRKTRRCTSRAKRWAALFTCMVTRGVQEAMDSSSFINALRRFFSIRGPARQIRSDCGTNFVGACNEIGRQLQDKEPIKRYLLTRGCEWVFNPPHAHRIWV